MAAMKGRFRFRQHGDSDPEQARKAWQVLDHAVGNAPLPTLYVDHKHGDDANPGTFEEPLRTVERACQVAGSQQPIKIQDDWIGRWW